MRGILPSMLEQAWNNSGGYCERCSARLIWERRGCKGGWGKWVAHSISGLQKPSLADYKILCWDCHRMEVTNRAHTFEKQLDEPYTRIDWLRNRKIEQKGFKLVSHVNMGER